MAPPSGAPYSYGKEKETHELIFSWLLWLAVLLVGAYARRRRRPRNRLRRLIGYDVVIGYDDGHVIGYYTPNNRLIETCSLGLACTSLILDIHVMIN